MAWSELGILVAVAFGAYLVGSFPTAYLAGRMHSGADVRVAGEGNVGARNVFHEVDKRWGVAVFAVDFAKGAAVALPLATGPIARLAVGVVFLILGHAFPVWLGFVGGKGLAAAGGFTTALMPMAVLGAAVAGGVVWAATRHFLPTVVTMVTLTFVIAPFAGVPWSLMAVALGGFLVTAVKRIIDEPRMRRIEAETGWDPREGGDPVIDQALVLDGIVTILCIAQFLLILWNRREMARPASRQWDESAPLVSLLVPARNEEMDIGRCVASLLAQDYPNFEIVVMDDGSTDGTADIVRSFEHDRVRLQFGLPLDTGWSGKNWACHQLAGVARGDILCFVDADTNIDPGTVSASMEILVEDGAGLVSLLPRSGSRSFSGKILLPMVTHALFALFPIRLIHKTRNPMLAVAFGPFLMVTRQAYDIAGGHAAAPNHVVDDVEMSRNVKRAGFRVRIANGTDLVETRWYDDFGDIWSGFSRNAYGALGNNPWMGVAVAFVLTPLLLAPFMRVGAGLIDGDLPQFAVFQVLLLLANRALTSNLSGDPLWTTPFHPITVAFWSSTLVHSMLLFATNASIAWKDRDTPIR